MVKTTEKALREWAMNRIPFEVGWGTIRILNRDQVVKMHGLITCKGMAWIDVVLGFIDLGLFSKKVYEMTKEKSRFDENDFRMRDVIRAARAGRLKMTVMDLVRYGGFTEAYASIRRRK